MKINFLLLLVRKKKINKSLLKKLTKKINKNFRIWWRKRSNKNFFLKEKNAIFNQKMKKILQKFSILHHLIKILNKKNEFSIFT